MDKTIDSYPIETMDIDGSIPIPNVLKILPIEGNIPFPHIIFPVIVTESRHIQLIKDAQAGDNIIGIFSRSIESDGDDDKLDGMKEVGVACQILKMFNGVDNGVRILVQGIQRVRLNTIIRENPYATAEVTVLEEKNKTNLMTEALIRHISELFTQIINSSPIIPEEIQYVLNSIDDASKLSDLVVSALNISVNEKQRFLEELDINKRLIQLVKILKKELKIIELNAKIQDQVGNAINKNQREFFLREQLKAIKKELGDFEDEEMSDISELEEKIRSAKLTEEAREAVNKELNRLTMMHPSSPEYTVSRNYIDWITDLPWGKYTRDNKNLIKAEKILNRDHFGLQDVKERILEYLAVKQLKTDAKSPILCFVGPPGVGKTSLGKSIAHAMNRKFIRFSVGGMHDEAEIRGHRKTYIGAMPGRIIQYMKRTGVQNPVIMLDEVDKIGMDFRGDPSSALLEVLDPEQNGDFRDNYLEVSFDLSKVTFIATANATHTIPDALYDRMETIDLPGYVNPEKLEIAKKFLIPRQIIENGLEKSRVRFTQAAVEKIIDDYTMESGVRSLERNIGSICRKLAREYSSEQLSGSVSITRKEVEKYLGSKKVFKENIPQKDEVGIVTGLAYTSSGGDVLPVEATLMAGTGNQKMTGQLGEVMKESVETAISYLRAKSEKYHIDDKLFTERDVHIHFPAAAIPKDGPSAGITITTALLSIFTGRKVRHNIAMTGEITLRGRVLPIGGVREKVTAAKRAHLQTVILPEANKPELEKLPDYVKKDLQIVYVSSFDEVAKITLV